MKKFLSALLFFGFFSFSGGAAAESVFMSGFEDLPLMDGLKQSEDAALSFDSPGGRIVEAYAQSEKIEKQKVMEFYDKTLPQLGWSRLKKKTPASSFSYVREGEELTISVDDGTPATVRFELMTMEKE
ncbi:MAG: hypothetical protein IJY17_08915 [Alphaproteobacteria bacterium]|nr:hypothetical protein [Alphaproteobacteria bacterium]